MLLLQHAQKLQQGKSEVVPSIQLGNDPARNTQLLLCLVYSDLLAQRKIA